MCLGCGGWVGLGCVVVLGDWNWFVVDLLGICLYVLCCWLVLGVGF